MKDVKQMLKLKLRVNIEVSSQLTKIILCDFDALDE
jgi:hypothetical protein